MDNDHSLLETVSISQKKNTPKGGFSGETDQHPGHPGHRTSSSKPYPPNSTILFLIGAKKYDQPFQLTRCTGSESH